MIKGISFLRPAGSAAVYDRLRSFFSALGFAPGKGWEEDQSRGASFLAPLGNLEFVDGQFPSTADVLVEVTALDAVHQAAAGLVARTGRRRRCRAPLADYRDTLEVAASLPSSRSRDLLSASGPGPIRKGASQSPLKAISPPKE